MSFRATANYTHFSLALGPHACFHISVFLNQTSRLDNIMTVGSDRSEGIDLFSKSERPFLNESFVLMHILVHVILFVIINTYLRKGCVGWTIHHNVI